MTFKAVALLSGGLDSAVALGIALKLGRHVRPVAFDYHQRHIRELESAVRVVHEYAHAYPKSISPLQIVTLNGLTPRSALTHHIEVPRNRDESTMSQDIPVTYVPARNSIFLSIGTAIAESEDADEVWVGFNAVDYSGYPDCRPEYVKAMQDALALGTKRGVDGNPIEIHAPLITETKAEIVRTGLKVNAPMAYTWSCYVGEQRPCGECDSCLIRAKAFEEVGVKDPAL